MGHAPNNASQPSAVAAASVAVAAASWPSAGWANMGLNEINYKYIYIYIDMEIYRAHSIQAIGIDNKTYSFIQ